MHNKQKLNQKDCERISFYVPDDFKTELKMMCLLTKRTMSTFIRLALQAQIRQLKYPVTNQRKEANENAR
jgi:hypothetical protein